MRAKRGGAPRVVGEDFDDDVMSLWTAGESLAISEDSFCSEESEDKMTPSGARPPLIPGTPSQKACAGPGAARLR